jgi:hypothetical protein
MIIRQKSAFTTVKRCVPLGSAWRECMDLAGTA